MLYELPLWLFFFIVVTVLFSAFALGHRINQRIKKGSGKPNKSTFIIESTLLSMLLSFTFSNAVSKYEKRKGTMEQEINAISTALLVGEMYPDSITSVFKEKMRDYIDVRIAYYEAHDDRAEIRQTMITGDSLAKAMFVYFARQGENPSFLVYTQQMVPALTRMADCIATREIYRNAKVPVSVLRLLMVLSVVVGFLTGYNQEREKLSLVQAFGYAILIGMTFVLILDLNNQRRGVINLEFEQKMLVELRKGLDE